LSQTYVLDTSTLLNLVRGNELGQQIDIAFGLRASLYRHTISIVTHGELLTLATLLGWGKQKREAVDNALINLVTVNIDSRQLVDAYVKLEEACRNALGGARKMGKNDIWIAATALVTGLPLITTDRDFDHLNPGLIVVHWVNPQLGGKTRP
jgi:predicted nucleic acid-binding protein